MIYKVLKKEKHQDQNMEQKNLKTKCINLFIKKGQKNKFKKVYNTILTDIKKKYKKSPEYILHQSINNLLPKIIKKKYKKKEFILPINKKKQINTSIKWLFSSVKPDIEIFNTYKKQKSESLKNKKEMYKTLEKFKYNR